jgi:hypothetical protein
MTAQTQHIGKPELYAIGQAIVAMFTHATEEQHPTPFLTLTEHPERHYDRCPKCDFDRVPGGTFKLVHRYKRVGIDLPYLAAHVLAAHGQAADPQHPPDIEALRELLNLDERELGRRIAGIASGAAPEPELHAYREDLRGLHHCEKCGDRLNLGGLLLRRGADEHRIRYIELHALLEHSDRRWEDREGAAGMVDFDGLSAFLGPR